MTFAAIEHRIRRDYRTPYRAADRWIDIVNEVAADHGVTAAEILGRSQKQRASQARHHAMFRVRNEVVIDGKPASFPRIGRWFGRDHSTVVHAFQRHGWERKPKRTIPHEYDGIRYESGEILRAETGMSQRRFYAMRAAGEIVKL